MADVTIAKVSGDPKYYSDIFREMKNGDSITFSRLPGQIANMRSISDGVAAGELTFSVAYTANELASGLVAPPQSVQAADLAPVAATAATGGLVTIRKAFAAGAPAEVILIAAGSFPFKARVLDALCYVSTGAADATAILRDVAAGGQTLATFDVATTGRKEDAAVTATKVVTPGPTIGLFLTRSDAAVVGEVVVTLRPES